MTMNTLKMTTLAALLGTVPVLSHANLAEGDALGITEAEIQAALEAMGAVVLEFDVEDDEIEVLYTLDGELFEAEISPETGLVLEAELEDDDDDDDDDADGDEDDDDAEDDDEDDDDD